MRIIKAMDVPGFLSRLLARFQAAADSDAAYQRAVVAAKVRAAQAAHHAAEARRSATVAPVTTQNTNP